MSHTKKQITARKLANTDQAVMDQRLTDLDYRLLGLMVSLADGATGIVKRRQTELAKLLGRARRSIQRCLDHLVALKYLEPIGEARKGIIRAYNVVKAEDATPVSHLTPAPPDQPKMRPQGRQDATPVSPTCDPPFAHTSLSVPVVIPSDPTTTEPGTPRDRADALGVPPDGEGKRPTNGHALPAAEPEQPTPSRPFPEVDAKIRALIAEPKLFAGSCVMEADDRSILINCLTDGMAAVLRPFADDIADGLGVDQVRFSVAHEHGLRKRA